MAKQVFWTPFKLQGLNKFGADYYQYDKEIPCIESNVRPETLAFVESWLPPQLAGVDPDATLILGGHGSELKDDSQMIFGDPKGTESATADQVARMLQLEGLKPAHKRIRVMMCYGGGLHRDDTIHSVAWSVAESRSVNFAATLARKLFALGYQNIAVGGYHGAVTKSGRETKVNRGTVDADAELARLKSAIEAKQISIEASMRLSAEIRARHEADLVPAHGDKSARGYDYANSHITWYNGLGATIPKPK